jgi:toxin-antitoxin system PIN domain toxin
MKFLLDANALIGLCFPDHIHHISVRHWLAANPDFSVCPITEGALVRFIFRSYPNQPKLAEETIRALSQVRGYEFWPDDISYRSTNLMRISGHKQVADAYLVSLADSHGGRLATFDTSLATVHSEARVIPYTV